MDSVLLIQKTQMQNSSEIWPSNLPMIEAQNLPKGVYGMEIYSKNEDKSMSVWYYCGKLDVC